MEYFMMAWRSSISLVVHFGERVGGINDKAWYSKETGGLRWKIGEK